MFLWYSFLIFYTARSSVPVSHLLSDFCPFGGGGVYFVCLIIYISSCHDDDHNHFFSVCWTLLSQEAWWEDPQFQKSVEEAMGTSVKKAVADEDIIVKDDRTIEIEKIAKEWAKREYFRQSMAGTVNEDMTEDAFTESVWDRAMFEGDLKYRQLNGETPDADAELESFQAKQERKQQTMLKRAKEQLKEILEEEDLVGVDLKATLDTDDDED